jgi:hypothetical protein
LDESYFKLREEDYAAKAPTRGLRVGSRSGALLCALSVSLNPELATGQKLSE